MTSARLAAADPSNGYEAIAAQYIAGRGTTGTLGAQEVRGWAQAFPRGAAILDLGCGNGLPISQALIESGLQVYGVDASPTMIAGFRARFPATPVECAAVEQATFFGRSFDGAVAWGLMFLLPEEAQAGLIRQVAAALNPGGLFLFTAPRPAAEWPDAQTGRRSVSLGAERYAELLQAAGLKLVAQFRDAGENHYYQSAKSSL